MDATGETAEAAGPHTRRPLSRRRRLLFVGILVLMMGLFFELVLQTYYYISAGDFLFRRAVPPVYRTSDTRCYGLKPNLDYAHQTNEFRVKIYTNAQGFRTDAARVETSVEKGADVYRVMFLGPSFTMGWANDYEDTYAALIGEGLQVAGKRVEVINVGTPSQGPEQQLCWLEKEGHRYRPDLVVYTSYGRAVNRLPHTCPDPLPCPMAVENGYLYRVKPTAFRRFTATVKNSAIVFYSYLGYSALTAPEREGDVGMGKELHSKMARQQATGDRRELIDDYVGYRDFVERVVGSDTRVGFIHIPLAFVVHPGDEGRWKHLTETNPDVARAETQTSTRALIDHGIPLVDTTEALITAGANERMYYWLDIHFTPAGNRVAMEAALPVLQRLIDTGDGIQAAQRRFP